MARTVTSIWTYVEISPSGEEGIVGLVMSGWGTTLPLVTSNPGLLADLDEVARQHSRTTGMRVERRRFDGPLIVEEEFTP